MNDKEWINKNFAIEQNPSVKTKCASCNKEIYGSEKAIEREIPIMCTDCFIRINKVIANEK